MYFGEGSFPYLLLLSGGDGVYVYREQVGFCIGDAGWQELKPTEGKEVNNQLSGKNGRRRLCEKYC